MASGGSKMKIVFIVNPVAGKGHVLKVVPEIKSAMGNFDAAYEIIYTERPGHASEIASIYANEGADIIFAVGGDGTVNEVMNGIINSNSALAILPCGSGNDFIRSLGFKGTTGEIIAKVLNGKRKVIDVGYINGRYFVNISSAGFDAEVVLATQKAKKFFLSGSIAYIAGLIGTIFVSKPKKVRIKVGDEEINDSILLMAVANGKYYGGGMLAAPDAILDDGYFDVCVIKSMPKIKLLFLFPQFMKGKHKKFKEVSFHRADTVTIDCECQLAVNVDGEVFTDNKASFKLVKRALSVIVP